MLKSWMFKSFRFSLFEWALAATAFYCGAVFSGVHENWITFLGLKPNEVGDFLAGVFGPLAFLWLVFGYYQQGEELKHSVEALKLQAEELRNSVEQQRELVEVSREAIAFEKTEKEKLAEIRNREIEPKFEVTTVDYGIKSKVIHIRNNGGDCFELTISLSHDGNQINQKRFMSFAKGREEALFAVPFDTKTYHVECHGQDVDGKLVKLTRYVRAF